MVLLDDRLGWIVSMLNPDYVASAGGRGWALALSVGVLALALARPEYVLILFAVLGACLLALGVRKRRLPIRVGQAPDIRLHEC